MQEQIRAVLAKATADRVSATAADIVLARIPFGAASLTDDTGTAEEVIAKWTAGANTLTAGMMLQAIFMGQVSSTATMVFRVRMGTTGTATDAEVMQFGISPGGAANACFSGNFFIPILTAGTTGTATASGGFQLVSALRGPISAAYAPATIDTTVANFISITCVQSIVQTLTPRAATLTRIA